MDDRKEIPTKTMAFAEPLETCRECKEQLIHDFYAPDEAKSRGMKLGEKQRNSFCKKCKILYINGKPN